MTKSTKTSKGHQTGETNTRSDSNAATKASRRPHTSKSRRYGAPNGLHTPYAGGPPDPQKNPQPRDKHKKRKPRGGGAHQKRHRPKTQSVKHDLRSDREFTWFLHGPPKRSYFVLRDGAKHSPKRALSSSFEHRRKPRVLRVLLKVTPALHTDSSSDWQFWAPPAGRREPQTEAPKTARNGL